ncbi:hypothetical protein ACP70R_048072 [Stipagrostis hirtigluma subsp. patula]
MEVVRVCTAVIFVLGITAGVASTANGVAFQVRNDAPATAGGRRFEAEVSAQYTRSTMAQASENSWRLYRQGAAADRKPIEAVTLVVVEQVGGSHVASTRNNQIELSAAFMADYRGNLKFEVAGVIFQEVARVWMNQAEGRDNRALVDGIAELARLRAGYAPNNWAKAGDGSSWNKGQGVTARFLDFLEEQNPGLVAEINTAMQEPVRDGDDLLRQITGRTTQELWAEYKAAYAA